MSNHKGSYMLNDVLQIVYKKGIININEKEKFREFALELIKLGRYYDCNDGEILEGIGEKIDLCYCCLEIAEVQDDGLCSKCGE